MLNSPKTFNSWSSQIANCLLAGSCKFLSLMTCHSFLTTSCLGITSDPTTSANSSDSLNDFVKADFFPRPRPLAWNVKKYLLKPMLKIIHPRLHPYWYLRQCAHIHSNRKTTHTTFNVQPLCNILRFGSTPIY